MSKPEVTQIHFNGQPVKPDIDDLLADFAHSYLEAITKNVPMRLNQTQLKQAIFSRLAAEAVDVDFWVYDDNRVGIDGSVAHTINIKALPIDKLKAIMEIKES